MKRKEKTTHALILCMVIFSGAMITVCEASDLDETEYAREKMVILLQDYLSETDEQWFLTRKKEYTIQAMMVSGEFSFHNDLEGTDYTVTDDGRTVVLKGTMGEMWPAGIEKVMSSYTKPDGSRIGKDDFTPRNEFIDITAVPASGSRYAMHVPVDVSVTVETSSGDILHTSLPDVPHGDGDFLVCEISEDGMPDLTDLWVVNGSVFPDTYDLSHYDTDMEQTESERYMG